MKYIDDRGTVFSISMDGLTGHVENGGWDFNIIKNNIESTGKLKVEHCRRAHNDEKVSFTFNGVKELKNE